MPRVVTKVRDAIESPDIRGACAVLNNVHAAMLTLDTLSPPAIEALRDEFEKMANERTGPRGELKHAWASYIQQALHDTLLRRQQAPLAMYEKQKDLTR